MTDKTFKEIQYPGLTELEQLESIVKTLKSSTENEMACMDKLRLGYLCLSSQRLAYHQVSQEIKKIKEELKSKCEKNSTCTTMAEVDLIMRRREEKQPVALFRFHRGSLDESMKTVVPVKSRAELLELIKEAYLPLKVRKIRIEEYCRDERIDWNTYVVTGDYLNDEGRLIQRFVAGFTNMDLPCLHNRLLGGSPHGITCCDCDKKFTWEEYETPYFRQRL